MPIVGNEDVQGIKANGFIGWPSWRTDLGNCDYPYTVYSAGSTSFPTMAVEFTNQIYMDWNTAKMYRGLEVGKVLWEEI